MFGVSEGPSRGWTSAGVLAFSVLGVVLLVGLVAVELRTSEPLIDLPAVRQPAVQRGDQPVRARLDRLPRRAVPGRTVLPGCAGPVGRAVRAGHVPGRARDHGRRAAGDRGAVPAVRAAADRCRGSAGGGLGSGGDVLGDAGDQLVAGAADYAGAGAGASRRCSFRPSPRPWPPSSTGSIGRASSVFNAGKQFGGAIGVALLTTVLATAGPGRGSGAEAGAGGAGPVGLGGFHDGFLAAAAVAVLAVAVAWTIRDADAAATMAPRRPREPVARAEAPAAVPGRVNWGAGAGPVTSGRCRRLLPLSGAGPGGRRRPGAGSPARLRPSGGR